MTFEDLLKCFSWVEKQVEKGDNTHYLALFALAVAMTGGPIPMQWFEAIKRAKVAMEEGDNFISLP